MNLIEQIKINDVSIDGYQGTYYSDNPEYVQVTTDDEGNLIEATQVDGTKIIGGDLKVVGDIDNEKFKKEIDDAINKIQDIIGDSSTTLSYFENIDEPEWLSLVTDNEDKIISGIKRNGKFYISEIENDDIDLLLKHINVNIIPANEIISIESFGTPETCISTADEDVTQYDNVYMGYNQVLKISDDMYYMYYDSAGNGDEWTEYEGIVYSNTNGLSLKFAYSTDGLNWTRGYPPGVEAPERADGRNACVFLYGASRGVGSCCVIKAYWDKEYPFRAISSDGSMYMWKSKDGVTFTDRKLIDDTWRDCQPTAIVRGNVIKVYNRHRPASGRYISVLYCDLDGNVLSPSRYLFGDDNLYQSSGGMLDERRDILFPTTFKQTNLYPYDKEGINCYIVDGNEVLQVPIDQNIFTENGRFGCVYAATGGLIEIKKTVDGKKVNEQYLYYGVRERCHDENVKLMLKFNSVSDFPASGDSTKIYVDTSTWKSYEWEGSEYVEKNPIYFNEIRRIKVNFGNDLYVNK